MEGRRVAVTLGSGGARGYAHIGILEVLDERGYDIVSIAGTSMGALVGGVYAAGEMDAYATWARGLSQRDVVRMLDPTLSAPGMIRGDKILAKVSDLVGGRRIEDLAMPFTAVATDLLAQKEVWFQRGPVDAAIRASIALPSVITPVVRDGRLLADGGLMNPLPVAATTGAGADLTIGVMLSHEDLLSVRGPSTVRDLGESTDPGPATRGPRFETDLLGIISSWLSTGGRDLGEATGQAEDVVGSTGGDLEQVVEDPVFGTLPTGLKTSEVMALALDALQSVVLRYRLAGYPPDLLITVPKASARTLDFHRAGEMIAVGRERAEEVLDRYERRQRGEGSGPSPSG